MLNVSTRCYYVNKRLDAVNADTGMTIYQQYINCCQTGSDFTIHPRLADIVQDAKGNMIYQEHVMRIVMAMANCTLGTADIIRRLMSKKKQEEIRLYGNIFKYGEREEVINPDGSKSYDPNAPYKLKSDGSLVMQGAMYNGFNEHDSTNVWDQMVKFGGYAFNKSHACAYADTAYQTAWMKYYFSAIYMAEVMTAHKQQEDLINSVKEAKRMGIIVLPPDINRSETEFTVEQVCTQNGTVLNAIRFGLGKIFGVSNVDVIINDRRANGMFQSLDDYFNRIPHQQFNKNKTSALIRAGCFDALNANRYDTLNYYYGTIRGFKPLPEHKFAKLKELKKHQNSYVDEDINAFNALVKYDMEHETLGMFVSGHPLDGLPYVPWNSVMPKQTTEAYGIITKIQLMSDKNKKVYARFKLETLQDIRECIMWSDDYAKLGRKIVAGSTVFCIGKKDAQRNQYIVNKLTVNIEGKKKNSNKAQPRKPVDDYVPVIESDDYIEHILEYE